MSSSMVLNQSYFFEIGSTGSTAHWLTVLVAQRVLGILWPLPPHHRDCRHAHAAEPELFYLGAGD